MRGIQLSLEKYFDDGVVQYWRLSAFNFPYRITVQPSGISIDIAGRSWNDRPCWIVVDSYCVSLDHASNRLVQIYNSLYSPEASIADLSKSGYSTIYTEPTRISERVAIYRVA